MSPCVQDEIRLGGETSYKIGDEKREQQIAFGRRLQESTRRVSSSNMRRIDPHLCAWGDAIAAAAERMAKPIRCEHKLFDRGSGGRGSRGWTYVIDSPTTGLAKIGYTSNSTLEKRIRSIQGSAPCELRLVALANGGTQLEALWHQQFKAARRHLEWFESAVVVPVFADAMSAAPDDGCARCVLLSDRVAGWRERSAKRTEAKP